MEDFVSYDIAVKLKEKGFKEKCYAYYFPKGSELIFNHNPFSGGIVEDCLYSNNSLPNECMASDFVDAPTISQVLKWLREEKKIFIEIALSPDGYQHIIYTGLYCMATSRAYHFTFDGFYRIEDNYITYEQAAIAGIEYVIDNLI